MTENAINLQNYLIEAMETIAQTKIANADFIVIKEGLIDSVVDEARGVYKVKYLDNIIEAISAYSSISYTPEEKVYLLFTNEDMEQSKIILGSVTPSIRNIAGGTSGQSYLELAGNIFDSLTEEIKMCSYYHRMPGKASPHNEINIPIINSSFNKVFYEYSMIYKTTEDDKSQATFSFGVTLKTSIPQEQYSSGGDYGICLELPTKYVDENGDEMTKNTHKYFLNTSTMVGNPYSYTTSTYVDTIITLDDYEVYDTSGYAKLYAYTNDTFRQKESIQENEYDIIIQDISLKPVKVYDVDDSSYDLILTATDGPNFLLGSTQSEKIIKPTLRIGGKSTTIDQYDCYWFKEDASVKNANSEGYNGVGGVGWRCLNKIVKNAEAGENLVLTERTLTVYSVDILTTCRYKCVLNCDGKAVSAIINIKNLNSDVSIEMVSSPKTLFPNSGIVTYSCYVNYPELMNNSIKDTTLTYEWARHDKNGNLITDIENDKNVVITTPSVENGRFICTYKYPVSYINTANTVYCSVYATNSNQNSVLIGTVSNTVTLTDIVESEFTLLLENGDILYKYDTDGNSPKQANYNGAIGSTPSAIEPIKYRIFKKDGSELTADEYGVCEPKWSIPKDSLFVPVEKDSTIYDEDDDYYYCNLNSFPYLIAGKFDAHKAAAEITLSVKFQNVTLQTKPRIIFTKDGEGGTNGSMYTALITHKGFAYNEYDAEHNIYRKLKFVWKCSNEEGNGAWYYHDQVTQQLIPFNQGEEYKLDIIVYKGTNLETTQNRVTWSMFDKDSTSPCFDIDENGILSKRYDWNEVGDVFCNTVEAKIQVGNFGETGSEEYIYAYYPIEITRLSTNGASIISDNNDKLIPHIADGYSTVVYAEDGTHPSWNSQPFKCISPSIEDGDLKGYYSYKWSSSKNLITENRVNQSCVYDPVTKFDNGISKNYVKVEIAAIKPLDDKQIEEYDKEVQKNIEYNQIISDKIKSIKIFIEEWLNSYNKKTFTQNYNSSINYIDSISNCIETLNTIKKEIYDLRTTFLNEDETIYFKEVGHYEELQTYGQEIIDDIQTYIIKVDSFDLIDGTETQSKALKINEDYELLSTLDLSYLNTKGLNLVGVIKNNILTWIKVYNAYIDTFIARNGDHFELKDEYISFKNIYINELTTFINNSDLKALSELTFDDDFSEEGIKSLLNDIKIYRNIILTLSQEQYKKDVVNSKENVSNNTKKFFLNVNSKIIEILDIYGIYDEEKNKYGIKGELAYSLNYSASIYYSEVNKFQSEKDARDAIFRAGEAAIVHVKPIVMTLNRYGNSYINGWDGNKLYIDDEGRYLMAPQVGAGYKENGLFTGIVIGVQGSKGVDEDTKIGLLGYNQGEQSIFLDSKTGKAEFGITGSGQIIIDPSDRDEQGRPRAALRSGNYHPPVYDDYNKLIEEGEGMEIDLAIPSMKYGNGNFEVDEDGNMTAQSGWIGGWEIGVNSRDEKQSSVLHSPYVTSDENEPFNQQAIEDVLYIDSNATRQSDGTFASATSLHGPAIYTGNHSELTNISKGFFLDSEGMSINSYFRVDKDAVKVGDLTGTPGSNYWTIKGTPTDSEGNPSYSYIAYGTDKFQGENQLQYDADRQMYTSTTSTVYLGTNGICLGDKFWVNPEGYLYTEKGRIANWLITKNRLLGAKDSSSKFRMDLNSAEGYISYTSSSVDGTFYNTIENREQAFDKNKAFFLGTDGLYFGKWNCYIDSMKGYFHSTYGDIGGFHFSGNEMESGKVPKTGYIDEKNQMIESSKNILKKARDLSNVIDSEGNTIGYASEDTYYPYNTDEIFTNYMKLSSKKQCLMFNTFDFVDLYSYFENTTTETSSEDDVNFEINKKFTVLPIEEGAAKNGVYIGKKGVSIGSSFSINNRGEMYSRKGKIGGWIITERSIMSPEIHDTNNGNSYRTVFKPEGTLQGGKLKTDSSTSWDNTSMWKLDKNGRAWFTNINITGGGIRIGSTFTVSNEGRLICTSARIGGWEVGPNNPGTFQGGKITGSGDTGCKIAGWVINEKEIVSEAGGTRLCADGKIYIEDASSILQCRDGDSSLYWGESKFEAKSGLGTILLQNTDLNLSNNNISIRSEGGNVSVSAGGASSIGVTPSQVSMNGKWVVNGTLETNASNIKIGGEDLEAYIKRLISLASVPSHTHRAGSLKDSTGGNVTGSTGYVS